MAKLVVIDAGHGGSDGGAGRGSYLEKNLVLQNARQLRDYLRNNFTVDVKLTRDSDTFISLSGRANISNRANADFFISMHYNAFNGSARGYEDFIWNKLSNSSSTAKMRDKIHAKVKPVLSRYGVPNRGKKKANFAVVRQTYAPAILVETAFCDNAQDQRLIGNNNSAFINDMIEAYGEGIADALNLPRKTNSTPQRTTSGGSGGSGTLYKVQVGAYGNIGNARDMESRLKRAGFPAFIYTSNGLHRVQVGAFGSYQNAKNMQSRLKSAGFPVFIYQE